ncbi:MAG: hypothetical protein AB4352_09210 [Hormoscilla sp.]
MKSMLKVFGTVVWVAYLLVLCGVGSAFADEIQPQDKYDNVVTFTTTGGPTAIRFKEINHDIKDGQRYEGASATYTKGKTLTINVRAGRSKTEKVANTFAGETKGGGTSACTANISLPGLLNFWVVGDLEIDQGGKTYICEKFIIAQGNIGTSNNWWAASPESINASGAPYIGPIMQTCEAQEGGSKVLRVTPAITVSARLIPNCVNSFSLSLAP